LGDLIIRARFYRVYQVGKLDGILDKENWYVVSYDIEIAFIGIAGGHMSITEY